jgi:hypothetical protein
LEKIFQFLYLVERINPPKEPSLDPPSFPLPPSFALSVIDPKTVVAVWWDVRRIYLFFCRFVVYPVLHRPMLLLLVEFY